MEKSASDQDASHRDAATTVLFLALVLGALWFVCCRHLSEEWRFNEQYSYGWFVPFFVAYLFWLRWEDRPKVEAGSREHGARSFAVVLIVGAAIILLPLRVFEVASSDYRPLGWLHAFAVVTITLSIVYLSGGGSWLRHFAIPVLFFLTAVPWVTAIEAPVIEGLMRSVAAIAAEVLAMFGIPAQAEGNLMRLPSGLVGVNEACSGVRSLQTSIMKDNGTTRQQDRSPVVSGQWSHGPAWKRLLALCSLLFAWLLAVEIGVEAWYRMHERTTIPTAAWSVRWPEDAPGYREIKTDERVRELLRFDSAHEALWRSPNLAETNYMFFFRWNPGSGTILRARAHRPDICLPSAG